MPGGDQHAGRARTGRSLGRRPPAVAAAQVFLQSILCRAPPAGSVLEVGGRSWRRFGAACARPTPEGTAGGGGEGGATSGSVPDPGVFGSDLHSASCGTLQAHICGSPRSKHRPGRGMRACRHVINAFTGVGWFPARIQKHPDPGRKPRPVAAARLRKVRLPGRGPVPVPVLRRPPGPARGEKHP